MIEPNEAKDILNFIRKHIPKKVLKQVCSDDIVKAINTYFAAKGTSNKLDALLDIQFKTKWEWIIAFTNGLSIVTNGDDGYSPTLWAGVANPLINSVGHHTLEDNYQHVLTFCRDHINFEVS